MSNKDTNANSYGTDGELPVAVHHKYHVRFSGDPYQSQVGKQRNMCLFGIRRSTGVQRLPQKLNSELDILILCMKMVSNLRCDATVIFL